MSVLRTDGKGQDLLSYCNAGLETCATLTTHHPLPTLSVHTLLHSSLHSSFIHPSPYCDSKMCPLGGEHYPVDKINSVLRFQSVKPHYVYTLSIHFYCLFVTLHKLPPFYRLPFLVRHSADFLFPNPDSRLLKTARQRSGAV
jgi:hypothetical protein